MSDPTPSPASPPGSRYPLLRGVRSRIVQTPRLTQHIYESGQQGAEPIVLLHANTASARFFEELMAALQDYYIVAPDLRGYGASEPKVVDATRGLRDYSDDVHALVETLGLERFHLLGWSLGGGSAMQYVLDHPEQVLSLTLHASSSPYGYGGTHGADGRPNYDDCAGSGGGGIFSQVRARFEARDTTADSPFSPRSILRRLFVKPSTFHFAPEREDVLVEQMLMIAIGDQHYPGDSVPSPNWPFFAPGRYGPNNALSPQYPNQSALAELRQGPPILWVHGADDEVVADGALADPAGLGKLGRIPGWPGDEIYPPQPMLAQLRAVLDRYAANGGFYREELFAECGHAPLLEHPEEFRALFLPFLRTAGLRQAKPPTLSETAPDRPPDRAIVPASDPSAPATRPRRRVFDGLFGRRRA